jgi:hypothetical protein
MPETRMPETRMPENSERRETNLAGRMSRPRGTILTQLLTNELNLVSSQFDKATSILASFPFPRTTATDRAHNNKDRSARTIGSNDLERPTTRRVFGHSSTG